ncbi:MAG: tetratricopeptide repeat protein [Bacteroidota bacterium]
MPDDSAKVDRLNNLSWRFKNQNQKEAFRIIRQSFHLASELSYSKGIADASHTLGMLYWYQGNYWQAADYYFKALEIREALDDSLGLARSYNNIGNVYFHQEKYYNALRYYRQSLQLREEIGDSTGLIYSYNNLGDVYQKRKDIEQALQYYETAYGIAERLGNDQGRAFVLQNLGVLSLDQQAYKPAVDYFERSLAQYQRLGHRHGIIENLNYLAKTMVLQKRNLSHCIELSQRAIQLAKDIDAPQLQANAQINLAAAFALRGEYKRAFNLERKSRLLNAEIVAENRERAIVETQIRYDVEKHNAAILQQENELLQKEKQLTRLYVLIMLCILGAGGIIGTLVYNRLRTQARTNGILENKNQQLQRSNEALERFAYVASHDLKEPLRSIGSFTTLLKRRYHGQFDREGQEYIDYIVTGVNRMYHLLEDLLKYSRLIHQGEGQREAVDLNAVVNTVKSSLDQSLRERAVDLAVPPLPVVHSNAAQMQQLFQNLLNNAIKYNDKVKPAVTIDYHQRGQEHLFAVRDNGVGINAEYHQKIFDVFQRLSRSASEGTGVGLAICKKIVEQHEGQIWVESEEGEGSTFYFTLPDLVN